MKTMVVFPNGGSDIIERGDEEPSPGAWFEYEAMAERCAKAKLDGSIFCSLAGAVSAEVFKLIDNDQDAFKRRVRDHRYAIEMESLALDEE